MLSSSSRLEQLPLELLRIIARCLLPNPETFQIFSLLSSRCRAACEPYLFRELHIRAFSRKRLSLDIEAIRSVLDINDRYRYVQTIRLSGTIISEEDEKKMQDPTIPREVFGPEAMFNHWIKPIPEQENEIAFQPLVELVKQTARLKLLDFESKGIVPRCLLRALNAIPKCKLNLRSFELQDPRRGLSDAERELVLSPCLHEVRAFVNDAGKDDQNPDFPSYLSESLIQLTSGISPNLRKVSFATQIVPSSARNSERYGIPLPPRLTQPCIPGLPSAAGPSVLHCLNVRHHTETVMLWLATIDSSKLQQLTLELWPSKPGDFKAHFGWLRRGRDFTSLQSLDLNLTFGSERNLFLDLFAQFLRKLRGLKSLRLAMNYVSSEVFDSVLIHRSSLEQLDLSSFQWLDPDAVQNFITDLAPHASQLGFIKIKIPHGNPLKRFQLFALLASAPSLTDLTLHFHPEDDRQDASLALFFKVARICKPTYNIEVRGSFNSRNWSCSRTRNMISRPPNGRPHDDPEVTDAKIRYIRALFGEMVLVRTRNHAGLGWPMTKMTLTVQSGSTLLTFIIERPWFELRDLEAEIRGIRIKELGRDNKVTCLWPCEQCKEERQNAGPAQDESSAIADVHADLHTDNVSGQAVLAPPPPPNDPSSTPKRRRVENNEIGGPPLASSAEMLRTSGPDSSETTPQFSWELPWELDFGSP